MSGVLSGGYVEMVNGEKIGLGMISEEEADMIEERVRKGEVLRLGDGRFINGKYVVVLDVGARYSL